MLYTQILQAIPRRTLTRHFLVSDRFSCVYVPSPKVASSSITQVLLNKATDGAQLGEGNVHREARQFFQRSAEETALALADKKYIRFCVVRHPVARLASAYRNKMHKRTFRLQVLGFVGETQDRDVPFDEFVEIVAAQAEDERDRHWRSQVALLYPYVVPYDHILRLENIASDWDRLAPLIRIDAPLPNLNRTGGSKRKEELAKDIQLRIADIYRSDMDAFGYQVDSAG